LTLSEEETESLNDPDSELEIKEEHLNDLTIPVMLQLPEDSGNREDQEIKLSKMTDNSSSNRA